MAEIERTRLREKESPALSNYELALKRAKDTAERNRLGRVVCRLDECPQELTRQGRLRTYLGLNIPDTPLQDWIVFTHEIRTASGKHKHQGGLIIYVIEGAGYSIVDGERIDWEKGDLVLLPLREGGVEHQHFNLDPEKPSLWIAFIRRAIQEHVASELTQTQESAEFKATQGGRP